MIVRKYLGFIWRFFGIALLAGCVEGPVLPPAPPDPQSVSWAPDQYVIGPDDVLLVRFLYMPSFDQTLTVQPDGRISLPMIAPVVADGQTPLTLSASLSQSYSPYLQRPDVAIIVKSAESRRAFIGGEVFKAGVVVLAPGMTIGSALIAAGGLRDTAEATRVVLLRKDGNGVRQAYNVNVRDVLNGFDPRQNILLHPYDIVVAPRSGIANVNQFVKHYIRDNMPIPLSSAFGV